MGQTKPHNTGGGANPATITHLTALTPTMQTTQHLLLKLISKTELYSVAGSMLSSDQYITYHHHHRPLTTRGTLSDVQLCFVGSREGSVATRLKSYVTFKLYCTIDWSWFQNRLYLVRFSLSKWKRMGV